MLGSTVGKARGQVLPSLLPYKMPFRMMPDIVLSYTLEEFVSVFSKPPSGRYSYDLEGWMTEWQAEKTLATHLVDCQCQWCLEAVQLLNSKSTDPQLKWGRARKNQKNYETKG